MTLTTFDVIMDFVYLMAMSVMETMIAEITVMSIKIAVCDAPIAFY